MKIIDLIHILEFNAPVIIKKAFSCKKIFEGLTTEIYEQVNFPDILDLKISLITARDATIIIHV